MWPSLTLAVLRDRDRRAGKATMRRSSAAPSLECARSGSCALEWVMRERGHHGVSRSLSNEVTAFTRTDERL